MDGEMIPIVMFIMIGFVGFAYLHFSNKNKAELQRTIQLAIEKGQSINPETIEQLMLSQRPVRNDFPKAVIFTGLAIAVALYAWIAHDSDPDLMGLSVFPLVIGIGYFIVHKYNPVK
ncbi:DUF6249 domain-containing protein [Thalassotalea crassostreae]|uniref:DUF6249 domain-containing protein n=1 Tax=Thalassotalea crassostreae TaxID=1763536 RepID=UPI0008381039|nr:DUF6249 domain-containing protein [Thalassotalea crassostreae]